MRMKLASLLVVGYSSFVNSWAPVASQRKVPQSIRPGGSSRPTRLFSASIQDTNDIKSNYSDQIQAQSSSLSTSEFQLKEEEQPNALPAAASEICWNDVLQKAAICIVGAAVLYQLMIHQQHHTRGWDLTEIAMRDVADDWSSYMSHLHSNPILTKAVTSGTVYTIGDVIAQQTEQQGGSDANDSSSGGSLDGMRVLRSCLAGFLGHGPLSHMWYNVCDYSFENILHLSAAWWPLKILVDQTVWGPIWNNTYIVLLGLMKRETIETIFSDMRRTTIPLIVSGLKLWPLAHVITYRFIPQENRVLWVDMVEIVWVTILATQAAGLADKAEASAAEEKQ